MLYVTADGLLEVLLTRDRSNYSLSILVHSTYLVAQVCLGMDLCVQRNPLRRINSDAVMLHRLIVG
jgi:hypothetical protein